MPWLWVSDPDWNQMQQMVRRIDSNTRQLANIQNLDANLNQLLHGQASGRQYLEIMQQMEQKMAVDLTAANAEITRNTDLTASIKAAFASLAQQVADLKTASTDPATQAAIDALVAQLKANDDANADAIVANTSAAAPAA